MLDSKGAELERDTTWTQHTELASLPAVDVAAKVIEKQVNKGETRMKIALQNKGAAPAVHVWMDVLKGALGEQVLPAYWNDNAITLMPGEKRELSVTCRSAAPGSAALRLMIEGFNVNPREVVTVSGETASTPRIVVKKLDYVEGSLRAECACTGANGPRYVTWPMPLSIDGQCLRCIRVAGTDEHPASISLPLPLKSGDHSIQLGGKTIVVKGKSKTERTLDSCSSR